MYEVDHLTITQGRLQARWPQTISYFSPPFIGSKDRLLFNGISTF